VPFISGGGSGGGGVTLGRSLLIYRFTVSGADALSIDTGVDLPQAGSNDWTNCDLLEVIFNGRTDEAAAGSLVNFVLNNDTGTVYDREWARVVQTTLSASSAVGEAAVRAGDVPGTTVANTSVPGTISFQIPNPTGTVLNKTVSGTFGFTDPGDVAQQMGAVAAIGYRPAAPAAITRIKAIPDTAGKKLKVGSQLLIYKRQSV
jgi:hypothetical protein